MRRTVLVQLVALHRADQRIDQGIGGRPGFQIAMVGAVVALRIRRDVLRRRKFCQGFVLAPEPFRIARIILHRQNHRLEPVVAPDRQDPIQPQIIQQGRAKGGEISLKVQGPAIFDVLRMRRPDPVDGVSKDQQGRPRKLRQRCRNECLPFKRQMPVLFRRILRATEIGKAFIGQHIGLIGGQVDIDLVRVRRPGPGHERLGERIARADTVEKVVTIRPVPAFLHECRQAFAMADVDQVKLFHGILVHSLGMTTISCAVKPIRQRRNLCTPRQLPLSRPRQRRDPTHAFTHAAKGYLNSPISVNKNRQVYLNGTHVCVHHSDLGACKTRKTPELIEVLDCASSSAPDTGHMKKGPQQRPLPVFYP